MNEVIVFISTVSSIKARVAVWTGPYEKFPNEGNYLYCDGQRSFYDYEAPAKASVIWRIAGRSSKLDISLKQALCYCLDKDETNAAQSIMVAAHLLYIMIDGRKKKLMMSDIEPISPGSYTSHQLAYALSGLCSIGCPLVKGTKLVFDETSPWAPAAQFETLLNDERMEKVEAAKAEEATS